ncbi:MAG: MgtC/SapB family protein [Planctomycetota bacterium]
MNGLLASFALGVDGLLEPWEWAAILRMMISLVIGGLIGLEREYRGRPAGLRTHILVCLGCCVVMLVSTHFPRLYGTLGPESVVRLDPARLAYGVVAGIGFLGAGVIMRQGGSVHGLTTAASLWCVAALGLGVGVGMYAVASVGTALALACLWGLRRTEAVAGGHRFKTLRVTRTDHEGTDALETMLQSLGATVLRTRIDHRVKEGHVVVTYELRLTHERNNTEIHHLVCQAGAFDRIEIE